MSEEKTTFTKSFEELLNKSIEANKIFMSEGTRLFKKLANPDKQPQNLNIFQNELVTKTFSEYVRLNVNHFNNLIDLGLSFVKNSNQTDTVGKKETDPGPSFILERTTEPGNPVVFQFLLDNVKQETVACRFIHSGFFLQPEPSPENNFSTGFTPLSFELKAGESKQVTINVLVPEATAPGLYISKVQVKGFEPAYFSIQLTITEKQKKQTPDGGKKEKSTRK
ncbi:MAG: hypothetical protein H7Y01_12460 [Ferruginibacter sp.]|nr:hypothetical protein [Chitinophagaceae bacterium]